MADQVDNQTIIDANVLLAVLVEKIEKAPEDGDINKHVLEVLSRVLDGAEVDRNVKRAYDLLARKGAEEFGGVVVGGTGVVKDVAGIPGERGQRAIRLLKASGRLLQCGKGRGKCLVVITPQPLEAQAEEQPEQAEPEGISVPQMLRDIRDEFRRLEKENNGLQKQNLALETQIKEKDERITILEQQIGVLNMASWQ